MRFITYTILFTALAVLPFCRTAHAEENLNRAEVERIIKEYLNENPEVILESIENYRQKQEKRAQATASERIKEYESYLNGNEVPSAGNPDGDVVVVEFFDYNCGYCKRALPDILSLLENDKNLRVVFMDMPILGPSSHTQAKWALAAQKQGKYFEYHNALMKHRGGKDEKSLAKMAKGLGLDPEQMKKDANSAEVASAIDKSLKISRDIGIRGTPAFIINGELYRGYIGKDGMKQGVETARKNSDKKEG